jgi:hypothetical protein
MWMLMLPNRRFVWVSGTGRVSPIDVPPRILDGTPHGSYYWNQNSTIVDVKIKGGGILEIRAENAVMVSPTMAISIDDFFSQQTIFLKVSTIPAKWGRSCCCGVDLGKALWQCWRVLLLCLLPSS